MKKQTFSVKAILRTDKKRKDGTCQVNYRVTINSVCIKLSSSEHCEKSDWNAKTGFFMGSQSSVRNSNLDRDISRLKDFLREQRSIDKDISIESVKAFWSTTDSDDFYEFFDKFCVKKFKELENGTKSHYILLRKRLKEFKKDIKLSHINVNFIQRFDFFLREKLKTGNSGTWGRHKNFKVVLGDAKKNNLIRQNPYDHFKYTQIQPEISPLNAVELKLIEKIVFSRFRASKGLELSRNIFLFTVYTGLRFSDVMSLKQSDIRENCIYKKQAKTKKFVTIPLSEKAKTLVNLYASAENEFIFPDRDNVSVNRDLKTIASLCKIKKNVHHHLARHTFGTTIANNNTNPFIVMQLMGHSNIKTTQRYVNTSIEDLSKTMADINQFN